MYLEEIDKIAVPENQNIECKSLLNRDDVLGWLKTVAGFANATGGDFYIGVEDKSNKLIGFEKKSADNERNYFNNQINEHLFPRPKIRISFIDYKVNENTRFVIKVHVEESQVKPIILKYKNVPSIFMRRDGFTNGATYEEIIEMSIKSKDTQYDILSSDVGYDPSCFSCLRKFYSDHNAGKQLPEKALKSMGFYDNDNVLANGALLFSDDYKGKKTEILCSVFSGLTKGSDRVVNISRFNGNITDSILYAMEFVCQRMNHAIIKTETGRKETDAYPKRALFEGIINSIAHRDYFLDGTQIQIDMFKDRLELSSPGGFYRGTLTGKTYDLSGIISKRRNVLMSDVLVLCRVMEAAGTGFDKIVEAYKEADEKHKPFVYATSDHFTLTLPDLTYEAGTENSDAAKLTSVPIENRTAYDDKVLSFCYNKARRVSEIAEHLGISNSTYLRTKIIGNLESQGYLEKNKISRVTYYKTVRETTELA